MKNFLLGLLAFVLVATIVFLLVSFIVANIHDLSVVQQWKDWGSSISSGWQVVTKAFKK